MEAELRTHILRAQAGDLDAFCYLATAFREQALGMARSVVRDSHAAEDAVQEGLLLAFQRLDQLDRPEAFGGWLATIVRHAALRSARRRRPDLIELDAGAEPPDDAADPAGLVADADTRRAVRAAVRELHPKARAVIERFYLEGESVERTAATLGLPPGTVKRRLFEARQRLRARLAGMKHTTLRTRFPL